MSKYAAVPAKEGFDSLSDENKVTVRAESAKLIAQDKLIFKFRAIKELLRCQIESTTSISRSDAHKMEKQVDFLLSTFRKIVRESGGSFTMTLELPNHISYDLFALRDEYEELEDAPLGPFYEEEDLNETSNFEDSIDHDGGAHIAEQKIAA